MSLQIFVRHHNAICCTFRKTKIMFKKLFIAMALLGVGAAGMGYY